MINSSTSKVFYHFLLEDYDFDKKKKNCLNNISKKKKGEKNENILLYFKILRERKKNNKIVEEVTNYEGQNLLVGVYTTVQSLTNFLLGFFVFG